MNLNTENIVSRSGRFSEGPSRDVADFSESISFDYLLAESDIKGSKAHAQMLCQVGIITTEENEAIQTNLNAIKEDIEQGKFEWKSDLEDVHMNIEAELTRRTPAGSKLHTGRSRNDQVALSTRIWQRSAMKQIGESLKNLQLSLLSLAHKNESVIIPGYTHLQRAQPVYFSHHLMAYMEMFDRDYSRLTDAYKRVNVSPLGAGAIAGSTLPINRELTAKLLEFVSVIKWTELAQTFIDV